MARVGTGMFLRAGALAFACFLTIAFSVRADDKPEVKKSDDPVKDELLALNRATGEEAQRTKLLALIKDKPATKKKVAVALKMQKDAKGKEKPFNFGASIILGRAAHYVKDYDTADFFLSQCVDAATKLESGEKILQAYDSLIDLYMDSKRFEDAIDTCEKFVELKGPDEVDGAKPFVLERLIQAKARQGKTDEAMRITEGLIQTLPDAAWYFSQTKGMVQREAGKFDDAIETYLDAIDKLDAAKRLPQAEKDKRKDRVRYILSGLYVDIKDIPKAAKQLETLIKKDPENPTYKNDLGFVLADNDMKLDEAAKLVQEALDLDKKRQEQAKKDGKLDEVRETAAYLDSMGWVLFKQKKYKEALPFLKKASDDEDEGAHLEIWDHLGDVYMALDMKKEAIESWQKGLTMEDISKRDIERRKAVTKKLKAAGVEPAAKPEKKKAE